MKKKITAIFLCVALVAVAVVGASLAYFTDTDSATNTFTVGKVDITLNEQQRGADGLETFQQNKKLNPIVGSAQSEKDEYGLPNATDAVNYVDKIVTVTNNTGSDAAYIRAYFAIPSALDDGYETFNAGVNVLHFNFGQYQTADGTWKSTDGDKWIWKHGEDVKTWNYYETTIGGIAYNVYYADYYTTVAAGATTEQFVQGVYLDKSFNQDSAGYYVLDDANVEKIYLKLDQGWNWNQVSCPVYAVAVQAAGFNSASEAINEAFGEQYNPWGGTVTNWQ